MKNKYILRLDDACERRDIDKWDRIENLLDKYKIKPLVGVIPHCEDPEMNKYDYDENFWECVNAWILKGWQIAMHGYNHVYSTQCGGINPVNKRSEFAGEPLNIQQEKIKSGVAVMREHGIEPEIFFAPSHTFDKNTLVALKSESQIRVISDTIAYDAYNQDGMYYIPQQSGMVRKLPFKVVTYCYHPNVIDDSILYSLEVFIKENKDCFVDNYKDVISDRHLSFFDLFLRKLYFARR